jgi:cytochrome c peroxidase
MKPITKIRGKTVLAIILTLGLLPGPVWGQSLKTVPVPEIPGLSNYVTDRNVAIQLGKALYWDMQVGSDGMTACATCHFNAGSDNRTRGSLNPGPDGTFQAGGVISNLNKSKFPFVEFVDPHDPSQGLKRTWNDIVGSQGVPSMQFVDIVPGNPVDLGTPVRSPIFKVKGENTRQVTGRNAPSTINAVFNFASNRDGAANNVYNGADPFGPFSPKAKIMVNKSGVLTPTVIRLRNASMASQAMAPPVHPVEMSWKGRTWPKIGKKMLSLPPLNKQVVHPQDGVLGLLSNATLSNGFPSDVKGILETYESLIKRSFQGRLWNNTTQHVEFVDPLKPQNGLKVVDGAADPNNTSQFSQMEANFSIFFGLSVHLYLATLVSDDAPFDRFQEGFTSAMTQQQIAGMQAFFGLGVCNACHIGPELTGASVGNLLANPNPLPPGIPFVPDPTANPLNSIEFMAFTIGDALYDVDFLNVTMTLTNDDVGRGGKMPYVNPVTQEKYPLSYSALAKLKRDGKLPAAIAKWTPDLPPGFLPTDTSPGIDREVSEGAFKVPGLRNIELTGPYFHNGGISTLMSVMDFYSRGGNFVQENELQKPPEISPIPFLRGNDVTQSNVIAFLQALTDPRVREERAPFDHPQLFVPHGVDPVTYAEIIEEVPAVGQLGRLYVGQQVLFPFLNVDHFTPKGY